MEIPHYTLLLWLWVFKNLTAFPFFLGHGSFLIQQSLTFEVLEHSVTPSEAVPRTPLFQIKKKKKKKKVDLNLSLSILTFTQYIPQKHS